ncbi:hypothetical protein ACEWY4_027463 [Coilia grayii]|uniref:Uncharacterized protein n=1 Tax=Coilia grayii TaxID=363190 RepID=A0ABD1ISL4_9TELE
MADVKDNAQAASSSGPAVSQEIIPLAERISLLYQLSYVCLAKFPNLEANVHHRAVETQQLFSSSKDLLRDSAHTVEKMKSLFPAIETAVENDKSEQLLELTESAKALITHLHKELKEILNRFDLHNKDIAATTSEVCTEHSSRRKNQSSTNCPADRLDVVCLCLLKVQKDLIELQKFWEQFCLLQEYLQNMTLVCEDLIAHLNEFKCVFLESITGAKEGWTKFGESCVAIQTVFSVQAEDAYKFLTVKPSSLSEEDWEKQYTSAKTEILINAMMSHSKDSHFSPKGLQDIEKLAQQEDTLDKYQLDKELALDNLQTLQVSNKQSLDSFKDSLSQAKEKLHSIQAELRKQQARLKKAKTVKWLGVGATPLGLIGLLAGSVMAVGGEMDGRQAEKAIQEAEGKMEKFQSNVNYCDRRVCECESRMSQTEQEIRQIAEQLDQITYFKYVLLRICGR